MMGTSFSVMVTGALPMATYGPLAKQVEDAGFDQLHIADDLVFRPAWPILTAAALSTSRIRLGPFIVTPQVAHPVYHAANLAALDELSGGRMVAGIGRGGFNPLIGAVAPSKPMTWMREAHALMTRMLTMDRTPFEGQYFKATEDLYFQFEVERHVPLYVGTWSPQTARLAGTIAPGMKADCVASPEYVARLKSQFADGRAGAGKSMEGTEFIVGPLCAISTDPGRAEDSIRGMLALLQPFLAPMIREVGIGEDEVEAAYTAFTKGDVAEAKALVTRRAIDAFSLTGTPDQVVRRIGDLIDAGADNIAFGPPHGDDPVECIRLIGEQILPRFTSRAARKVII
ncbi:LLM class flavin-dependent oxidoreductase [Streptomyces sp. 2A115]|uniref:LLM class flavin-dependent oxidoreductase n=1 Tax=Streptomyces sp. 2A115 TaxID=3457439 RepID=UPI003FD64751